MKAQLRDPNFWLAGIIMVPLLSYGFFALYRVMVRTFPPEDYWMALLSLTASGLVSLVAWFIKRKWLNTVAAAMDVLVLGVFVLLPVLRYGLHWIR